MKLINSYHNKILILFVIFIYNFYFSQTSYSEIIKPDQRIKPIEVVKIQLESLMKNDLPKIDFGIEQTWEFAHPNNQKYTGPIEKFKKMLKGNNYSMLLNHIDHKITKVHKSDYKAVFEVVVLDDKKKYYKFLWQVEKNLDGKLKNCWLTTNVSPPVQVGNSI